MNPHLQQILHDITVRLSKLEEAPQRQWVGLTDEEIAKEFYKFEAAGAWYQFARAIEAKLKQKNGYAEEKNHE